MKQPHTLLHRGPTRRRWRLAAGALVLCTLGIAACGSRAASPPVAHSAGSHTTTLSQSRALLLAGRCLREHGIPDLPDPTIATSGPAQGQVVLDKQDLVTLPSSVLNQARLACRAPLERAGFQGGPDEPASPQQVHDLLAFARCLRNHGIPNFPGPNGQGGFDLAGTGINGHQLTPAQLSAARTCLPAAHGYVNIPSQGTGAS